MKLTAENSKGEKMKYRLARSMKECMKTMSVDNITVKQKKTKNKKKKCYEADFLSEFYGQI